MRIEKHTANKIAFVSNWGFKVVLMVSMFFVSCSQSYGQFVAGFGNLYGDDIEQYVPNIHLYYFSNHEIRFGPEFAYFLK